MKSKQGRKMPDTGSVVSLVLGLHCNCDPCIGADFHQTADEHRDPPLCNLDNSALLLRTITCSMQARNHRKIKGRE
jgi:hypothetical protein